MKCPIDGVDLVMADRQGVEIDYCPRCRGVWLDRGELDKLIERSASDERRHDGGHGHQHAQPSGYGHGGHADPRDRYFDEHRNHGGYRKHKRGSFLSEFFDFD